MFSCALAAAKQLKNAMAASASRRPDRVGGMENLSARDRACRAKALRAEVDGEKWAVAQAQTIKVDAARASSSWLPRDGAIRAPPRCRPCSRTRSRFARPGK